jgi:hypothetical protein
MKNVDTIFSNNYGAKSLILMTKAEIENCMNSDKLTMIKDLVNDIEKFYPKLSKLSSHSKYEVAYYVKCILHDFGNMHELLNKTKLLIRACCKISSTLMIDDAFALICSETCKTLDCDRVNFWVLIVVGIGVPVG